MHCRCSNFGDFDLALSWCGWNTYAESLRRQTSSADSRAR
jgi:hypothetical protein